MCQQISFEGVTLPHLNIGANRKSKNQSIAAYAHQSNNGDKVDTARPAQSHIVHFDSRRCGYSFDRDEKGGSLCVIYRLIVTLCSINHNIGVVIE